MFDTWIEIKKKSLTHNYKNFQSLSSNALLVPVVKSNAYGHDLDTTYLCLKEVKPKYFCVNYVAEGIRLRSLGFKGRIMVVGPCHKEEWARAKKENLEIFVRDQSSLKLWIAAKKAMQPNIHLKIDTGMNRQGFLIEDAPMLAKIFKMHTKNLVGICSHFANVEDVQNHSYADLQMTRFEEALREFTHARFPNLKKHIASSASALILPKSRYDLMRVGISLYGIWPSQLTRLSAAQFLGKKFFALQPVLSWYTRIASLKTVPAGEYVGYGCTYRTVATTKIAVLPVGYFEGYPRLAGSSSAYVLVKGVRSKVIGRICMNMMMVDVTHLKNVRVGDRVTLIGSDGKESIEADDVAGWAQTIPYELLSRLHPKISRKIV